MIAGHQYFTPNTAIPSGVRWDGLGDSGLACFGIARPGSLTVSVASRATSRRPSHGGERCPDQKSRSSQTGSMSIPPPNAAGAVRAAVGIPATAQVIGTVGRLTEVKRQDLLLRATAGLCRKFPDLHLLVVGDGPERTALAALAVELGISDRVCWAGYRPDPERYLAAMDVFALTSRSEGLPLSLLEAWAVGKPVVCSAVGGIPGVVTSGHNGLLFPSGDVGSLIAALSTLLSDTTIACRIAQAGQILVRERFSFARMAAEYESRYLSLIASGGR